MSDDKIELLIPKLPADVPVGTLTPISLMQGRDVAVGLDLGAGDATYAVAGSVKDGEFRIDSYSLIDHCIYCGAKDLDVQGTRTDGSPCEHPTRVGGPLSLR